MGGILQKDLQPTTNSLQIGSRDDTPLEKTPVNQSEVERIQKIMLEQKLFLKQELTLKEFSEHACLTPRETSKLINQGLGISFIDFVNQYRIARFKELADDNQLEHLSLLGLAFESGFNSKSTFNRVFKKMEGKSPSSYLNDS